MLMKFKLLKASKKLSALIFISQIFQQKKAMEDDGSESSSSILRYLNKIIMVGNSSIVTPDFRQNNKYGCIELERNNKSFL